MLPHVARRQDSRSPSALCSSLAAPKTARRILSRVQQHARILRSASRYVANRSFTVVEANPGAQTSRIDANFPPCRFGRKLLPSKHVRLLLNRLAGSLQSFQGWVECVSQNPSNAPENYDSFPIRPVPLVLANEALLWGKTTRRPRGNPASNKGDPILRFTPFQAYYLSN